ncbi:MAG TPA: ABC transporter ATP-binding protein, partial [Chthoniobacterales bacterium]|nr:ABC transporter ATP-binding protein [Chthoniobacterales bacterium]
MATVTLKNIGGIDLTVRDREFVVLTGPAGCGSAPIVRLIAGLSEVVQGEIFFDERRLNDLPPKDRDVALLSHDYTPYPGMSVYENLAIALEQRKFASTEIRKRVTSVAETLGFQNELAASPGSLSTEQQRLVGLARVMVRQARVCLFDEPLANLGRIGASRGRAAIAELRQRASATILYATSDPTEALALDARTVVMDAGVVQQDAAAQAIFDEPENVFVAKFFGDLPMNLVYGTLKQERDSVTFTETGDGTIGIRLPASRFPSAKELAGQSVILGFRADAVEIVASPEEGTRSGAGFRALVERSEPKGSETELYLRTGAHEL